MAIAFDAASSSTANGVSSRTFSHTCTGSDLTLLVFPEANSAGATVTVSGITYNGVAMSLAVTNSGGGGYNEDVNEYCYYLANPATGANNIVVTYSGSNNAVITAVSYTGTNTASPIGNTGTGLGSSTTPNVSVTTTQDNSFLVATAFTNNSNPTVNGITERVELHGANAHYLNTGDKLVVSAGAASADWTMSTALWAAVGVELKAAAAATVGGALPLMGVGT